MDKSSGSMAATPKAKYGGGSLLQLGAQFERLCRWHGACVLTSNISGEATNPLGKTLREAMRHT
jgi:hypothetical protein